jgi:anaerobic selenocysteine-containing dehydrogenase
MGMMNVIISEDLIDREYVENHTEGFDELRERVQAYSPERVAEITAISPEDIRTLATFRRKIEALGCCGRIAQGMENCKVGQI